jgi:hypothetical protein
MDQHGKEEEEHSSEDSRDHQRKDDDDVDATAAEGGMENHGKSMDHQRDGGGYEEAEEETLLKEVELEVEVVGVLSEEEEASPPQLAHHPCSLLQLLLRACAGCLGLHGYCSDDDDDAAAAPAVAELPQEEGDLQGGSDKAASVSFREETGGLICRYTVVQYTVTGRRTFAVLFHAGSGRSGAGSEEEAAAAQPSERRPRWRWRKTQLGNGDLLPSSIAWPMYGHLA